MICVQIRTSYVIVKVNSGTLECANISVDKQNIAWKTVCREYNSWRLMKQTRLAKISKCGRQSSDPALDP